MVLTFSAPCIEQPPHVRNGLRVFMGKEHGYRARYKCFSGYRLMGMNSSYLTCNFGNWEGGTPSCEQCEYMVYFYFLDALLCLLALSYKVMFVLPIIVCRITLLKYAYKIRTH